MATRLYKTKTVAENAQSLGNQNVETFTYVGFSSNSDNTNYKLYDVELVKQDLINHFYIKKGEKLENPAFGTVIWDLLFEPFTEDVKKLIAKDVQEIVNYDPRISVNSVTVDSTSQGIRIEVSLVYIPFNINEQMTFNFNKENRIIN